ncbi:hypothetical protein AVEN_203775-1 [Araneus ventricosus]|uniref:Uncharacterized protein n=1 Tax=Araneus ventricosus TaxID=182803 RepID=A0A4Y2IQS2_ARAVE|nr:hypothetical protein AVEN_203775-1 [Araneus ventricosus]
MVLSTRNGDTEWNVSALVDTLLIMKKVGKFDFEVLVAICSPLKGPDFLLPIRHRLRFRPDGTAHHGAQHGKAATGSGYSQRRRLPWC